MSRRWMKQEQGIARSFCVRDRLEEWTCQGPRHPVWKEWRLMMWWDVIRKGPGFGEGCGIRE